MKKTTDNPRPPVTTAPPPAGDLLAFYLGSDPNAWPPAELGAVIDALELTHGRNRARDMGLIFLGNELRWLLAARS